MPAVTAQSTDVPPADEPVAVRLKTIFAMPDCTVADLLVLLAQSRGRPGTAKTLARRLGFPSRYALAHTLGRHHLPPLSQLEEVARVLTWVHRWQTERISLCRQATDEATDPASWYRTVRRVTGDTWSVVRELPLGQLTGRLRDIYGSGR